MKRTSIRFRLMVIMICLATIPVITVTWIATNNTKSSVQKEIISANTSRMLWADQYLNELIEQIDIMFYTLQINQKLMAGVNDIDNPNRSIQFNTQKYIQDTLMSSFYANSRKVDELSLYIHSNHKAFAVNYATSGTISNLNITKGVWSRILKRAVNMYFKQSGSSIYAYHSVNRFPDKKLLGGLSVRVDKDVWREVSGILQSEKQSSIFLMNDEGELLSGSSKMKEPNEIATTLHNLKLETSDLEFKKTSNYYFFMKRVGDGQLILVKAIPLKMINQSASSTMMAGLLTGCLFAAISLLISVFVSFRISRPIMSLARTMSKVQILDFEKKAVYGSDEIGMLERCYNSMMQRIKELIEEEYQREIELKNAQLMALQAQINPHFLNNTLHLIGGMALSNKMPEIYNITRVMADLLRYSIGNEGNMVSLKEELVHMRNYIYIQERRFVDRCSVKVTEEEEANEIKLPKFTLQPIVENAFEHGLQRRAGAWNIEVRIKRIGKRICIIVRDDGVGIETKKLAQLRESLKEGVSVSTNDIGTDLPRKRGGIGLRNVNARLKLQFGEKYGARIYSRQGTGTMIVLALPV